MKTQRNIILVLTVLAALMVLAVACKKTSDTDNSGGGENQPPQGPASYELSYWVDMDVVGKHLRGYWNNIDDQTIDVTPESYVANALRKLKEDYGADKLYVIYHRQYEIADAKTVYGYWKKYGTQYGVTIVPCVVLQSYAKEPKLNFTDTEITDFGRWAMQNIDSSEFAVYDVYTRDQDGSMQDAQLKVLRQQLGNVIVRVGMQPIVKLNGYYKAAVQDCWTAECQGRTNELWENPVYYKGSYDYGRRLLEKWVKDRINNDARKWVYCLIPVAWDYDVYTTLPSYDCPGDNALTNDPPISGRLKLCHRYISGCYKWGMKTPLMGGYSCDLHILQANSAGCGVDAPDFYTSLRENKAYTGKFSSALNEIGDLYKQLANKN